MAHHPYPNRDRSLRQLDRGRSASGPACPATLGDVFAYLESEEHREKMRSLGTRMADLFARVTADDAVAVRRIP
jgi:hypothetical protein